ncbi:MAG TPA: sensor domain-containing diguanylate cyclase [Bacillales bacterium]|nr:sensor domain-containing diguanylate cyclase [Bacillales bacterium]
MTARIKAWIWVVWAITWPILLYSVYVQYGFHIEGEVFQYLLFVLLAVIVALMPIQVKGTDLVVTQGVLLAIFLEFGLFAEVIAQQIAMVAFLIFLRVDKKDLYRYPLNLLMFFFISYFSGIAFFAAGGDIGSIDVTSPIAIVPILVYVTAVFMINQLLLTAVRRFLMRQRYMFLGKDVLWEAVMTLLMLPIALALFSLYSELKATAILFVGAPFISLSVMLRMYHSSEKINDLLQKTTGIGRELTERLEVKGTLTIFIEKITEIFPVDIAYILDVNGDDDENMKILRVFEKNKGHLTAQTHLSKTSGVSGRVYTTGAGVLYFSRKQWYHLSKGFLPKTMQSIISVPMRRNQEITGIITLAAKQKHAFARHHLMVLEILANYLAVAVENARNYEETKNRSERDPLTNLYNYRFFMDKLDSMFATPAPAFPFSILLIDLDHFKSINDTYGHDAGNQVLCQFSERLVHLVEEKGTVARYGGEEFVVILHRSDERECLAFAEEVCRKTADQPFFSKEGFREQKIRVTASIGVATAPLHGEDAMSLIRNADRAMFTGAKQQGRNRVAAYTG